MELTEHALKDWIPYKLIFENKVPLVQWLYVGQVSFTRPFFEETISSCKSHRHNSSGYKCVSSLESMVEWAGEFPVTAPVSFIFHVSRCGSTLLSQLIGLDQNYIVLSEVPFFDELLRLPFKAEIEEQFGKRILKAAIKLVGQNRLGEKEHLFIKTDSWHIPYYKLLRELYPSSPTVLLYRSPDEVVYSHQRHRGMHAIQQVIEPEVFGFKEDEIMQLSLDAYTAKVLETYMLLFADISTQDPLALLLDYKQGVVKMTERIGAHLNIQWSEAHRMQMKERSEFHSKYPAQNFTEEIANTFVPEYLQAAMKIYLQLEKETVL